MIQGIGIDAVELDRIQEIIEKKSSFIQRVLTPNELAIFEGLSLKRQVEFLGGRLHVKKPSLKLGTLVLGQLVSKISKFYAMIKVRLL